MICESIQQVLYAIFCSLFLRREKGNNSRTHLLCWAVVGVDLLELVALVARRRSLGSGQVIKKADEQKVQQGRRRLRFARGAEHGAALQQEQAHAALCYIRGDNHADAFTFIAAK